MHRYTIRAPAKVNLTLHVLGKRPDGFHDIDSLMVPVSIFDSLEIAVGGTTVRVEAPESPELSGDDNLCARAARAFARVTGMAVGVRVRLWKEIPVAAGLGGGSSDAAAVLRVLARHHRIRRSDARLQEAALEVGSDVPFFLLGKPAVARGRGELLQPAPRLGTLWLVVVKPTFGVSAGLAYRTLAELRGSGQLPRGRAARLPPRLDTARRVGRLLHNDLEPAVATLHPIPEISARLSRAGASEVLMSGSGSCLFSVFPTVSEARKCARSFDLRAGETLHVVRSLKHPPGVRDAAATSGR